MTHPGHPQNKGDSHPRFRRDFAVIVCDHVFSGESPVLLVVRDEETSWQFLCGSDNAASDDCHSIGVAHLLASDPSLAQMAALPVGSCAERASASEPWMESPLDA